MTVHLTKRVLLACCLAAGLTVQDAKAQVTDSSATVTSNSATWIQPATGNAVTLSNGANGLTITNELGGVIESADATGIENAGNNTIDNAGRISGAVNGVDFVNGQGSGSLINQLTGLINSASRAVNIGGTVNLTNLGDILGTGDQRNGTVYGNISANNYSIDNSGTIDAGINNLGAGFSAELAAGSTSFTLDNRGTIAGRGNAGAGLETAGDGIRLERTRVNGLLDGSTTGLFAGTITNSGSITSAGANGTVGGFRAVNGVSFQGTLANEVGGVISGVQNGVYFGNPTPAGGGDHTGGVVENDGTISSDSRALNIDGIGLEVNNRGQIVGAGNQRNGTVYADSTAQGFTLNNQAGGTIDAGAGNLGAGFSVELSAAGNDFDIVNAGSIVGRGDAGAGAATAGDGIRLERTRVNGLLDGSTTGLFTGTIANSGSIMSAGANGTVGGFRAVNGVSFQGELNNSGTISGVQNGVYFGNPTPAGGGDHTGGVVNNSGAISSDSRALNIDGLGLEVNNSGLILATGTQRNGTVYADSTAQDFVLNNSGVVDAGEGLEGAAFSVELSDSGNNFTINNSGQLLGRGAANAGVAQAGDGIRLERTRSAGLLDASSTGLFTGVINNSGTVSSESNQGTTGGFRAVNGVSFQGTLNNSGTISGVQNGVYFGNPVPVLGGADHTGGVVNNFGVISSDSRAFNLDGNGLTVNNSGDILATGRQRNGTFYVDGTGDNFTLNNLAAGTIDARGGAGSGVSVQVGSSSGDVQNGSIVNAGQIIGSGELFVDAGVRLFTNNPGATFSGDIVNESTGLITADNAPAVLVQEGVLFDGSLINRGTIDGSLSLATGDLLYQDSSVQSLTIASLLENELVDVVTGSLVFDGTLDLGFAPGFLPEVGQEFDLFDFSGGQASGGFDQILAQGVIFDTARLLTEGVLSIVNADAFVANVPEPASFALLALGGMAWVGCRRRR